MLGSDERATGFMQPQPDFLRRRLYVSSECAEDFAKRFVSRDGAGSAGVDKYGVRSARGSFFAVVKFVPIPFALYMRLVDLLAERMFFSYSALLLE